MGLNGIGSLLTVRNNELFVSIWLIDLLSTKVWSLLIASSTSASHVPSIPMTISSLSATISLAELLTLNKNKTIDTINKKILKSLNIKKLYAQTLKVNSLVNIEDVLYIKDTFSSLPANKIAEIMNIANKKISIKKPKINITTKSSLRKQVTILITVSNAETIVNLANQYIANINRYLKKIKSDISADFIHKINDGIIITTNKAVVVLDLNVIKKYLKSINNLNSIESPCLFMSKLYLKIIRLSYILNQTNSTITSDIIESIIKEIHIFNNIILALKLYIIKTSPKLDMAVI